MLIKSMYVCLFSTLQDYPNSASLCEFVKCSGKSQVKFHLIKVTGILLCKLLFSVSGIFDLSLPHCE